MIRFLRTLRCRFLRSLRFLRYTRTHVIDPALEQILRGDEGERFCFFLREAYAEAKQVGHISSAPSSSDRARLIGLAKQISLLNEASPGVLQWTPVGYELANVAKEYATG